MLTKKHKLSSLIVHDVFVGVDIVQEPLEGLALQPINDRKPILEVADLGVLKTTN